MKTLAEELRFEADWGGVLPPKTQSLLYQASAELDRINSESQNEIDRLRKIIKLQGDANKRLRADLQTIAYGGYGHASVIARNALEGVTE